MDESVSQQSAYVTRADLEAMYKRIKGTGQQPHVHIIHPRSRTEDGWYLCDCGPLPIRNGVIDWEWGQEHVRRGVDG